MANHPFTFFIEFIELSQINEHRVAFFALADEYNYSTQEEWVKFIEFDKHETAFQITRYFKDYLLEVLNLERVRLITALDLILFEEKNIKEGAKKLDILYSTWQTYQKQAESDKELKKYGVHIVYKEIGEFINQKKLAIQNRPYAELKEPIQRLQWSGQVNQLVSLFYDLGEKKTNNGQPFILTSSKQNLTNFILANFIDKDGNEISFDTVDTGLKASKIGKRASGNKRIDITPYTLE